MKATELSMVTEAVKLNVANFKATKGENTVMGVEEFTEEMIEIFDTWYDREIAKLLSQYHDPDKSLNCLYFYMRFINQILYRSNPREVPSLYKGMYLESGGCIHHSK